MEPASSDTDRVKRFEASLSRFDNARREEHDDILPACRSKLLHHTRPTERAYLLLHGFTNCPAQFKLLADALYERGHNVFVPLAEGHGRRDGSPVGLSRLTADGIAAWTDSAVEIAEDLGDTLEVVGFSFGGVCAAYAAKRFDAVDRVTLLAPGFLPWGFPVTYREILPRYIRLVRERYVWWDPIRRNAAPLGPHGYRQLSRRGIGEVFELANRTRRAEPERTIPLEHATLMLNARDLAISASAAERTFTTSIAPLAQGAQILRIGAEQGLPHDFIDPFGPTAERARENTLLLLGVLGLEPLDESVAVSSSEASGESVDAGGPQ